MAKINELSLTIKVSELLRDDEEFAPIMDSDSISQLIGVIQELSGGKALVEIVDLKVKDEE
jgi:hypothetical protein